MTNNVSFLQSQNHPINSGYGYKNIKANKVKETGSFRAAAVSQVMPLATAPVGMLAIKGLTIPNSKLTPEQAKTISDAAENILKNKGLKDKGVEIIHTAGTVNKSKTPNFIRCLIDPMFAASEGKNAFFVPQSNKIFINKEKLPTAIYHEMGHSFNANKTKVFKILQKNRNIGLILASTLGLFCAFTKNEKAQDGKELTKGQKAKNTVRNNAGKLALLAMMPMLLEEGMASIRGCKWAKSALSKDLYKKVLHTNIAGYFSYLGVAAGACLAAVTARKIKDNIMNKQTQTSNK